MRSEERVVHLDCLYVADYIYSSVASGHCTAAYA